MPQAAAGRPTVAFGRSDGLATVEVGGIQPACLKARDGKLWFGTAKGATFVDPKELKANLLPPPVIIDEVRIDDEVVEEQRSEVRGQESGTWRGRDGEGGDGETASADARAQKSPSPRLSDSPLLRDLVTLQPHQRRVEFRFTGLSFTAPAKVQFRYRMEADPDWVDGGIALSASYTRLPPGTYWFRRHGLQTTTACGMKPGPASPVIVVPAWQTGGSRRWPCWA